MKAEITLTAETLDDVKAAAIDIQSALDGYGWQFGSAKTAGQSIVLVLLKAPEDKR